MTVPILNALTGLHWTAEHPFAAIHVGEGPGIRERLRQANLRNWRFDFACPDMRIAVEVEGGGWTGGRHTSGVGFAGDLQKYDAAMRLGWSVYRCSPQMVTSGQAYQTIAIMCGVDQ